MTQPENVSTADMLTRSIEAARAAIANDADLRNAFRDASRAAQILRDAADDLAHLRALVVYEIAQAESLSLAQLAKTIGVSKARAGQLVNTGLKMSETQDDRETGPPSS